MNDFITIVIGYVVVFFMGVAVLDFLSVGFLHTYLQVKASRGKKVLIQVRGLTRDYYRVGKIEEGNLVYKFGKNEKRLSLDSKALFRVLNVIAVQVDEEKNAVGMHDFSVVRGFDAVKWDNLLKRALYRPSVLDQKEKLILILVGLCIIVTVIVGILVFNMSTKLDTIINVV